MDGEVIPTTTVIALPKDKQTLTPQNANQTQLQDLERDHGSFSHLMALHDSEIDDSSELQGSQTAEQTAQRGTEG